MPPGNNDDFVWGVATSAYQIEGAAELRGESIWDRFSHSPGNIVDGSNGDVACDHYHRWREDVALMADLGVSAYRFSIAWTRVIPNGVGPVSEAGIAFYCDLVDELLDKGITPWATLYHWDLPQSLEDAGGWPERATVDAFVDYTDAVTKRLGDRVKNWITVNEPWAAAFLGYRDGVHAPGRRDWSDALAAAHHLLLAHGMGVGVIRDNVSDAWVGIALDCRPSSSDSDLARDVAAQRHFDGFRNRWFFDPVFGRGYPDDMVDAYRNRDHIPSGTLPFDHPGDLTAIAIPIDFLGLNYYTSVTIQAGAEEADDPERPPGTDQPPGFTEMGWRNTPDALENYLVYLHEEYDPAQIVVTENGASYGGPPEGGDDRRIEYLASHIAAVENASAAGVPVTGYFVWSLLDNFEWGLGFTQRFGLVWLDPATKDRVSKRSFDWYRDRISEAKGRLKMSEPVAVEEVDSSNWRDVAALSVRPHQERFVAPVIRYLVLCAYGDLGWKANAISAGGEYVGFVMDGTEDEDNSYWIGGFVIDASQQRRGYGRAAMEILIARGAEVGCDTAALSYDPANHAAKAFYAGLGFVETDEMEGDEIVARLPLTG